MEIVVEKGRYVIEFFKSITEDEYAITVIGDFETIMVRSLELYLGIYMLEIKIEKTHDDIVDTTIRQLKGIKFKKNFEVMKRIIDRFFK